LAYSIRDRLAGKVSGGEKLRVKVKRKTAREGKRIIGGIWQ